MLDWLNRIFSQPPQARANAGVGTPDTTGVRVDHDADVITLTSDSAPAGRIFWKELEAVAIVSSSTRTDPPELSWLLAGADRRRPLLIPMGAPGEHALVHAMQARLDGFDNMAVVEAMSAKGHVSFTIWDVGKPHEMIDT
jgi:hypothetical protein